MHDFMHFEQLATLLTLLRPLAKATGPWPFVVLVVAVLAFLAFASFELFGLAHHFLKIAKLVVRVPSKRLFYSPAITRPKCLLPLYGALAKCQAKRSWAHSMQLFLLVSLRKQ